MGFCGKQFYEAEKKTTWIFLPWILLMEQLYLLHPLTAQRGSETGIDEQFGMGAKGDSLWPPVGRWGTARLWSVTPFLKMMSQPALLCLCGGFIYFHSVSHTTGWSGVGKKDSYSRNTLRNSPATPSHSERKPESSPRPTGPAWPAPHHLPVPTSSHSPPPSQPQPHELPLCFTNSPGMVPSPDLGTDSSFHRRRGSSPSTYIDPILCSNVIFSAGSFLISQFQFLWLTQRYLSQSPYLFVLHDIYHHWPCYTFFLVYFFYMSPSLGCWHYRVKIVHCAFLSTWNMVSDQ